VKAIWTEHYVDQVRKSHGLSSKKEKYKWRRRNLHCSWDIHTKRNSISNNTCLHHYLDPENTI